MENEQLQKVLTVAGREKAQWCCLSLWGGWRTQRETSGSAKSFAGETGEENLQSEEKKNKNWGVKKILKG